VAAGVRIRGHSRAASLREPHHRGQASLAAKLLNRAASGLTAIVMLCGEQQSERCRSAPSRRALCKASKQAAACLTR